MNSVIKGEGAAWNEASRLGGGGKVRGGGKCSACQTEIASFRSPSPDCYSNKSTNQFTNRKRSAASVECFCCTDNDLQLLSFK